MAELDYHVQGAGSSSYNDPSTSYNNTYDDYSYFDSADYSMHKQKHEEAKVEEDLHQPSKLNSSPAKPN